MNFDTLISQYQKVPVAVLPYEEGPLPLVSVCIQTYRHAAIIAQCLDGVMMQQTSFPFEIWIGEDDSNDGTRDICLQYARLYPKIIRLVLHHRANNMTIDGRPSGRFSFLYNSFKAKGTYIALCEGDDYWTDPLKLQKQFDYLEQHPDTVLCYHPWRNLDRQVNPPKWYPPRLDARTSTLMYRHIITEWPETITLVPNGDTFLKYLLKPHGRFQGLQHIEPAVRCIFGANMMGHLSNYQKLPRRIRTFEVVLQTVSGTPLQKEVEEKLSGFRIKKSLLDCYHQPTAAYPRFILRAITILLSHPHSKQTFGWVKEAWQMRKEKIQGDKKG